MNHLRSGVATTATFLALLCAACGSAPPPERLLRMPLASPGAVDAASAAVAAVAATAVEPWQLVLPIPLPAYLDAAALRIPTPGAGLDVLPGVRWAEPLRDAVPRLLRHDLAQLRGEDRVWTAPLPAGLASAARLRVELLAFEAEPGAGAVRLAARWSLVRGDGSAPTAASAELRVPVPADAADATVARADALVLAHRQALRALAERIAATR